MSGIYEIAPAELVRNTFAEAAGLLGERGWGAGSYSDVRGHLCAAGAINVALTGNPRSAGPREVERMSSVGYTTIQAAKRAFNRWVNAECRCFRCNPMPARDASARYVDRYTSYEVAISGDPFAVSHTPARPAPGRMPTDYYDTGIASWNDNRCLDAAQAVATFLSVPDEVVAEAVRAEFAAEHPLRLPTLGVMPEQPTPRRVLALV